MNMKKLSIGIIVLLGLIIGISEKMYAKQKPHIPGIRSASTKSIKITLEEVLGSQVCMIDNSGIIYDLEIDNGKIIGTAKFPQCESCSHLTGRYKGTRFWFHVRKLQQGDCKSYTYTGNIIDTDTKSMEGRWRRGKDKEGGLFAMTPYIGEVFDFESGFTTNDIDGIQKKRSDGKVNKPKASLAAVFGTQVIMEDNYGIEYDLTFSDGENSNKGTISGTVGEHCCGPSLEIDESNSSYDETHINIYVTIPNENICDINGGDCISYKYKGKFVENENGVRLIMGTWNNVGAPGSGNFKMRPKGISGIVKDAITGMSISTATVIIVDSEGVPLYDENGGNSFYQFVNVPDDTYTITASADGYQTFSQPVLVTGKRIQVDFSLTPIPQSTGNISGIVSDATSGEPISGASVTIEDLDRGTTTDSTGAYRFENVPGGPHKMTASAVGYQESQRSVEISVGENQVDFSLTPIPQSTGNISGTVAAANCEIGICGIINATVIIADLVNRETKTDSAGFYQFEDVPFGQHTIKASAEGYQESSQSVTVVGGGNQVDFTLTQFVLSLGTLSLSKDTAYLNGDTIVATVVDVDRNSNSSTGETLTNALAVKESTGTDLTLSLVENGVNSGTFLATFRTGESTDSTVVPPVIKATQGGIAEVTYTDTTPFASTTITLSFSSSDAIQYFDKDTYSLDSYALITLIDAERNTSITTIQSLLTDVFITSTSNISGTKIRMIETGLDTGIFQGSIKITSSGGTVEFASIQTVEGDVLTISYFDEVNTTGSKTVTDTATVLATGVPQVDAGNDQVVTLPNSATLDGTVTYSGDYSATWAMLSGPGKVSFANFKAVDTTASFSEAGKYVLQLTAKASDSGLTGSDEVTITVNPSPIVNQAPTVNAGSDQNVLWYYGASLNGTVTDDGLPNPSGKVTTLWTKVSGPGDVTFMDASAVDTSASFSITSNGTYVLRLTADDSDLTSSDDVYVTVFGVVDRGLR